MKYHNLKKQKWINSIKIISALRVPLETCLLRERQVTILIIIQGRRHWGKMGATKPLTPSPPYFRANLE